MARQHREVRKRLELLTEDVAVRCGAITLAHDDWPCRAGCDDCCRSLASVPELTAIEWEMLSAALERLAESEQQSIAAAMTERRGRGATRPIACPLLDDARGTCRVYDARPVACRTYGFYADRDGVLGCARIEARARFPEGADVVWGNHAAALARVADLGDARSLLDWYFSR